MKLIIRFFTAFAFIVSGFVKAVDPVGFSFKLEEYADVFRIGFLSEFALPIAVFVSCAEVLLGVLLLFKIKLKQSLAALILLCVFFAFLTFYSAYYKVVTDCGCFGDALKFTPWQSFAKDILLLVLLIALWIFYRSEFNKKTNRNLGISACLITVILLVFVVYQGIAHEPVIDFRDYKIGTDLNLEKKKIAENPDVYKTFYTLKNKKTGQEKRVSQDEYVADQALWQAGTPWEIVDGASVSELVHKGYQSEVAKFKINDENGADITAEILRAPKAFLLFSYDPAHTDSTIVRKAEALILRDKDALAVGVSTVPGYFKALQNATMDGTAIKTIARSRPFVLTLQHGKIVDKRAAKDFINH